MNCNPILVRLAWHDSGTYDRTITTFPKCGGANGSIRFKEELAHGANAGLSKAINYLKPFKEKYPSISWADLIQLASVTAIQHAGGPLIPIRFGRVDSNECPPEGMQLPLLRFTALHFNMMSTKQATYLMRILHLQEAEIPTQPLI